MGRSVAVVGLSVTNGHDGYPPVHVVTGSDYASCNGRPIALVGSLVVIMLLVMVDLLH